MGIIPILRVRAAYRTVCWEASMRRFQETVQETVLSEPVRDRSRSIGSRASAADSGLPPPLARVSLSREAPRAGKDTLMPSTSRDAFQDLSDPEIFEQMYREYKLKFKPQETPEGTYQAFVIVTADLGYIHTCGSVTPNLPAFASQVEAARAGWAAGVHWVDQFQRFEQESSAADASGGLADDQDPHGDAHHPPTRRAGRG